MDTSMTFQEWCQSLHEESRTTGKYEMEALNLLNNMTCDCTHDRFEHSGTFQRFRDMIEQLWIHRGTMTAFEVLIQLMKKTDETIDLPDGRDKNYFFCRGHIIQGTDYHFSRVVNAARQLEFIRNFKAESDNEGTPQRALLTEVEIRKEIALLEQGSLKLPSMRGHRPFAWITYTKALADCLDQVDMTDEIKRATAARDALALPHPNQYGVNLHLIEIVYPPNLMEHMVSTGKVRAPTCLDGFDFPYYRSNPVGRGSAGQTLSLDSTQSALAGLPEMVHLAIPATSGFQTKYIGVVQSPVDPPKLNDEWDETALTTITNYGSSITI